MNINQKLCCIRVVRELAWVDRRVGSGRDLLVLSGHGWVESTVPKVPVPYFSEN